MIPPSTTRNKLTPIQFEFSGKYFLTDHVHESKEGSEDEDRHYHLASVKAQYDTIEKLSFYEQVMGDGTDNIHFGKWDNIDHELPGAYGRASEQMTDYMFKLGRSLLPPERKNQLQFVDLGSGTGAAARRLAQVHSNLHATCLNLCTTQNFMNDKAARELGLGDRIRVRTGSFEAAPLEDNKYDLLFSQDALVHAFSKKEAYLEANRIARPGGVFIFCDLMCGDGEEVTQEELATFASTNMVNDWLSPAENVACMKDAGWQDVTYIDLSDDIRTSFQLMLKKVEALLVDPPPMINTALLQVYKKNLAKRTIQVDQGVFKWGVIHARKPINVAIITDLPYEFCPSNALIRPTVGRVNPETDVVVIDFTKKMDKNTLAMLPSRVSTIVTLSAGMDHIDVNGASKLGIKAVSSGREIITESVAEYAVCLVFCGLRNIFGNLGAPFPKIQDWNLAWNANGVSLNCACIGIVGMGEIASAFVRKLRALFSTCRIIYQVPMEFRDKNLEADLCLEFAPTLMDLAKADLDILLPLCPLFPSTVNLISSQILKTLPNECGIINVSRGQVVDTDALVTCLKTNKIKYAILDTTFPEPLPDEHELHRLSNAYILPHYATNTSEVRKKLVSGIEDAILERYFGSGETKTEGSSKEEGSNSIEQSTRQDLALAHQLTAKYNMDMLTWNHISARLDNGFLITPGNKMWANVEPKDIVYSSSNCTADIIHEAIYNARPDVKAVIHLHTRAAMAISCLACGFQPMIQDAAYFYKRVARYSYDGVSNDPEEQKYIAAAVAKVPGCNTLLMNNHGFCCFGSSVREAWVLAYYFERCCQVQLDVLRTGQPAMPLSDAILEVASETSFLPEFAPGACEWDALAESMGFQAS